MKIQNTTYINMPAQVQNKNEYTKCATRPNFAPYSAENIKANSGINFKAKPLNKLYEEYDWFIRHDHNSAIDAFLKIEDTKESMDNFLTHILSTDDRSKELLDSIVYQPRRNKEINKKLSEKVGSNSKNIMTFLPNSPYKKSYEKYIDDKYGYMNSISGLLRIRPDWKGDVLLEKFKQIWGDTKDFYIGDIPNVFPGDHFFKIADYLSDKMEIGLKQKKKIPELNLDNRVYEFNFFTDGRSDKNVFGVFTPEGKKFVFKMGLPEKRSLDAPFALGTLAKIDRYLTMNKSPNSAPHCYYNHGKNLSVYKYIEHSPVNEDANNLDNIKRHLPDFDALGLSYNDSVGSKNCFLLDNKSSMPFKNPDYIAGSANDNFDDSILDRFEWVSVDNDHVTYNNRLQPQVSKYHAPLPNAMQMFY